MTLAEVAEVVFAETAMPAEDYITWLAIRGQGHDLHAKMALRMHEMLAEISAPARRSGVWLIQTASRGGAAPTMRPSGGSSAVLRSSTDALLRSLLTTIQLTGRLW